MFKAHQFLCEGAKSFQGVFVLIAYRAYVQTTHAIIIYSHSIWHFHFMQMSAIYSKCAVFLVLRISKCSMHQTHVTLRIFFICAAGRGYILFPMWDMWCMAVVVRNNNYTYKKNGLVNKILEDFTRTSFICVYSLVFRLKMSAACLGRSLACCVLQNAYFRC